MKATALRTTKLISTNFMCKGQTEDSVIKRVGTIVGICSL